MSGKSESKRPGALLDHDAVRDALEQFDTIVDLDRRFEEDVARAAIGVESPDSKKTPKKTAPQPTPQPTPQPAPQPAPQPTPPMKAVATARPPAERDGDPEIEPEIGPELEPEIETEINPDIETEIDPDVESEIITDIEAETATAAPSAKQIQSQVEDRLAPERYTPVESRGKRPRLVPRSAEPDLIGIDSDELAWADDEDGPSRTALIAVALIVLAVGAASMVFLPGRLQGDPVAAEPTVERKVYEDPVTFRASQQRRAPLPVAAPAGEAVAEEPLPMLPAGLGPSAPFLLADPVRPTPSQAIPATSRASVAATPPPVATSIPSTSPRPSANPEAPRTERTATTTAEAVDPRPLQRFEPAFTAQDTLEQKGGTRIVLRVLVDERGAPIRVMVKEGVPGTEGVSKAIQAILRTRFEAGRRQGQPVRAWSLETFELPPAPATPTTPVASTNGAQDSGS